MTTEFNASSVAPTTGNNVSDKYVVINSERLICELQKRGFILRHILQPKTGRGFHTVRMRSETAYTCSGETLYPEIVFRNSYDKTSAFSCEIGIFRLVCSNGLTIRANEYGGTSFKTKHIGNEAKIAEQIALEFIQNLPAVWQVQERLALTKLTEKQAIDLAMKAAEIRWKRTFSRAEARKLLKTARPEDKGRSAWQVFNVLQEKIVNGGSETQLEGMKRAPKPITQVRTHGLVNEQLFTAVYEMIGGNLEASAAQN